MTTAPLVFLDTETTGLSLDDDIWEFAGIRREPDGTETEHHLFVAHDPAKCSRLPESFLLDHQKRWPEGRDCNDPGGNVVGSSILAARLVELTIDRPHIVGAVPNFDTERLARLIAAWGLVPNWHYHLIDVENLAVGWLAGRDEAGDFDHQPPWKSDDLSRACEVEPPAEGDRHTAMGDARWAMRLYDRIVGESQP